MAALVEKLELEALGGSQLDDRRRREDKDRGVPDLGKSRGGPGGDGLDPQLWFVSELPVFQLDKDHAHVLPSSGETHAGDRHDRFDGLFLILFKIALNLVGDLLGLLQGGPFRQRELGEKGTLILVGEIGGGHPHEEKAHEHDDQDKDRHVASLLRESPSDQPGIGVPEAEEVAVEPTEEGSQEGGGGFGGFVPRGNRLEEGGAEHRRQDQGHDHGEQHGGDDGDGELLVDDPGRTREEGHGAEDR